jgi:hypothetical protein
MVMRWGRPLLAEHLGRRAPWRTVAQLALAGAVLIIGASAPAGAETATAPRSPAPPAANAPASLSPVVVGTSEPPKADDPLVKVEGATSNQRSGTADGGGSPRGYSGLAKLTGLILFLAFAWGWWAWGGELPARADQG